MLIVEHNNFEEYLASLSKPARKNYKYAEKANQDLTYSQADLTNVERFMKLWASQLVRGNPIEWAFPYSHIESLYQKGELKVYEAKNADVLAVHFIQKRNGYWECHPPMYDKKYNDRYLGKYMWFNLIKHSEGQVLNLGGGVDRWREMIRRRDEFPNPKYKWAYVPENIKDNPELAPDYYIDNFTLKRYN